MLDSKARQALSGLSQTLGTGGARIGLTPNAVSLAGIAVTAGAAALILRQRAVAAGILLIAGGLLDFVDGSVARASGRSSIYGAFVDSVGDRISDGLIFGSLAWALDSSGDRLGAAAALACLVLAGLVPYARAKAESLGLESRIGLVERAERIIAIIAGLIFGVITPVLIAVAVLSAVTFVQRFVYVRRQVGGLVQSRRSSEE